MFRGEFCVTFVTKWPTWVAVTLKPCVSHANCRISCDTTARYIPPRPYWRASQWGFCNVCLNKPALDKLKQDAPVVHVCSCWVDWGCNPLSLVRVPGCHLFGAVTHMPIKPKQLLASFKVENLHTLTDVELILLLIFFHTDPRTTVI